PSGSTARRPSRPGGLPLDDVPLGSSEEAGARGHPCGDAAEGAPGAAGLCQPRARGSSGCSRLDNAARCVSEVLHPRAAPLVRRGAGRLLRGRGLCGGDNPQLAAALQDLAGAGCRVVSVSRFRQSIDGFFSSAAAEPWRQGLAATRIPDVGGVWHHEGIILEFAAPMDVPVGFMRLDYGRSGLCFELHRHLPHVQGQLPDSSPAALRRRGVPRERGDLQRLRQLLAAVRGWRYNIVTFNCISFADLVWELYVPPGT
ncbi:unnamed protein product, partial [Prorocentrum cordatum]